MAFEHNFRLKGDIWVAKEIFLGKKFIRRIRNIVITSFLFSFIIFIVFVAVSVGYFWNNFDNAVVFSKDNSVPFFVMAFYLSPTYTDDYFMYAFFQKQTKKKISLFVLVTMFICNCSIISWGKQFKENRPTYG